MNIGKLCEETETLYIHENELSVDIVSKKGSSLTKDPKEAKKEFFLVKWNSGYFLIAADDQIYNEKEAKVIARKIKDPVIINDHTGSIRLGRIYANAGSKNKYVGIVNKLKDLSTAYR
jgi:hypothetical protein